MKTHSNSAFCFLLLVILLVGCNFGRQNENGPRVKDSPVTETSPAPSPKKIDSRLRRIDSNVMAGFSDPLSALPDDKWHEILPATIVKTDENGEALLKMAGCATVYLFQLGRMIHSECSKSEKESGNANCLADGALVYDSTCANLLEQIIQTPTAQIKPTGTWFVVAYLPDRELTITVVLKGSVEVTAVTDTETGAHAEPAMVTEGQFYLTTTDKMAQEDAALGRAQRRLLNVSGSEEIVRSYLGPWLERIRKHAEEDKVPGNLAVFSKEISGNADVIDCDCGNVGGGILALSYQKQCIARELMLRARFKEMQQLIGTCDSVASGPNARPAPNTNNSRAQAPVVVK